MLPRYLEPVNGFALALSTLLAMQSGGVSASLDRVPERKAEWEKFAASVPKEQRAAADYLLTYMPLNDLKTLEPSYVAEMIRLAYAGRKATAWGPRVPREVFLDAVLPYASVTEPRRSMRAEFQKKYLPLAKKAKTPGEAALAINATLFRDYKVTYNTKRLRTDQSPPETIDQGMATCTGLSIMLVDALRAVGVPARLAGIAAWPGRGGNHTWVEVWDKGGWHFVGAAEPDASGLDHAWFAGEAGGAIEDKPENAIWAVTYRDAGGRFPIVWKPGASVFAENVTARYRTNEVKKPRLMIEVVEAGMRVEADVEVFDAGGASILKGKSFGPQADVNFHLTAEVKRASTYRVVVRHAGRTVERTVQAEQMDTVLRIDLNNPDQIFQSRFAADAQEREGAARVLENMPCTDSEMDAVWNVFRAAPDPAMKADFDANVVKTVDRTSPYKWRTVGEKPKEGWGLVIAMHGGGGAPKSVNDGEWNGMFTRYYADQPQVPGYIYLALRAPNDEWNGVYDDAIVPLVERLIRQFVKFGEVDPNHVYACGASHGGYGAFVIGPKAPHLFAAVHAAAGAPTDGETMGENLRNLRFTWALGESDTAYGRRERCDKFAEMWAGWKAREGGFDGGYELIKDHGHLINDIEKDRITKLRPWTRNAVPKKLTWIQTDGILKRFYWVEALSPADQGRIDAVVDGNTITLTTKGQGDVALWLSKDLVDLTKTVTIVRDGKRTVHEPRASLETFAQGLEMTGDPALSAPVRILVSG